VAQPFLAVRLVSQSSATVPQTVRFVFRSRLIRFEEAAPDAFSQFSPDNRELPENGKMDLSLRG
jgi:hypothetical protein